tara:strand:- start:1026 stop:1790 length:765 start_codon:yes stop_codon:yes gene_type:complete
MILENKKILVTGAAGLLGTALVKELVKKGAKVIATDISLEYLEKKLIETDVDLREGTVEISKLDLSNESAVISFFDSLDDVNGAVNCAYPRNKNYGKHFFDVNIDDFNDNVSLNLGSSFLLMQQCASYFKRTSIPFSLVNISSIYGVVSPKFEIYNNTQMTMPVEYAAIKSGLIHLSRYVTTYIGKSDFRVNVVSPGGILDNQPSDFLNAYKNETFGKGMLNVSDILGTVIFLLSSNSRYINGQNIIVDDGFSL